MGTRLSRRFRLLARAAAGLAALVPAALAQTPGKVDSQLKISQTSGGFSGDLDGDDRFGGAVAVIGDLDGDGRNDLLVGAPRDDDGAPEAGAVWVLFLNSDGSVRETRKISATQGGLGAALHGGDHFGSSIAALGDIDGDGVPDAAVGLPDADGGHPHTGLVRILLLHADGTVKSTLAIGSGLGGFPEALKPNDAFGFALAGLGDLDHDGIPDLAVGAVHGEDDLTDADTHDAVWILFLKADGSVRASTKIANGLGGFGGSLHAPDDFGSALALVGDVDGDGLPELAVGAPGDDDGAGAVWILHLNANGTTQGQARIGSDGLPTPLAQGDRFGRALAATGDIDGDGRDDLAVGLPDADEGGPDRGAVRLLLLTPDATVASQVVISGVQGGFGGALHDADEFGFAAAATPVDDSTGHARLFVGAWRDDDGGSNQGAAWVLDLQSLTGSQSFAPPITSIDGEAGQPAVLIPPPPAGDDFIGDPVVVVPTSGSTVSVQEFSGGSNLGEIGFNQQANYQTGLQPVAALAADFTSDAQPDIVTVNRKAGSVSMLVQQSGLTDAGGGFAPSVDTLLPFDANPVAVRSGDLDGDGDLDLVVAGDAGLTSFLGNGHGALFGAAFAPVAFLSDLQLGDTDGDGDLDVVAASGAPALGPGAEIGFATSLANDGTGHLNVLSTFASGKAVASVLLADFDLGGSADALLAVHELDGGPGGVPQGRISLWIGDGAGGFLPSSVFAGYVAPNADGVHPRWGSVADVNNDGRPDALYTSNDSLAFPAGTFAAEQPPLVLTLLLGTPAGGLAPSTIPTAYAGKGVAPLLHDIAPTPHDGNLDCIVVWTQDTAIGDVDSPQTQPLTFLAALVGDGLGGFTDASPNQFLGAKEPGDALVAEVGSSASDAAQGPDLLLPDQATGALDVFLGDGAGQLGAPIVVPGVDPIDPNGLPAGGIWQGGPRTALALDLDGDPDADVAVYSRWDDLAGLFASQAAFVTLHGDGTGHFGGGQSVLLPRAGEMAAGDVLGDGAADLAVTLRTDGSGDAVALYAVGAGGALQPPQIVPAPAGYELTGGLELANVDGQPGDEVITTGRLGTAGALIVISSVSGTLHATAFPLGATWDEVRSLDVGLIDGDGLPDVALGLADGRLVLARGTGGGAFEPLATDATAAAVGGGALRLTELNGDGHADIVSSTTTKSGKLDQAFVRELFGTGNGAFQVVTLPGLSSVGAGGALRPGAGDLDGDGATDLLLAHGGSGNVSLLLNQLGSFAAFGSGKPGSGGFVPHFTGTGYTTLGGAITLTLGGGLGGAPALMWVGAGPLLDHPPYAMSFVGAVMPIVLGGSPAADGAGTGSFSLTTKLPDIARFAGVEIVLQFVVADPGATTGPGPKGAAFSNGLSFTILP